MRDYAFRIVNVFAESPLAGNPLAVFEDARGMDDATMQALALQFNLSETTFVLPSAASDRACAHLHADVRDAVRRTSDARHRARRSGGDEGGRRRHARDACRHRPGPSRGTTCGRCRRIHPVIERWARRGRSRGDARAGARRRRTRAKAPPLWVDTGSEQLVIPLASADAVRRAAPRADLLLAHGRTGQRAMAYVFALEAQPPGSGRNARRRCAVLLSQARHGRRGPGTVPHARTWAAGCSPPARLCRSALQLRRATRWAGRAGWVSRVSADRQIGVSGRVVELARGVVRL